MKAKSQSEVINIGDIVNVEDGNGVLIREGGKVTAISPCGNWIQTNFGLAYMPSKQVKKVNNEKSSS